MGKKAQEWIQTYDLSVWRNNAKPLHHCSLPPSVLTLGIKILYIFEAELKLRKWAMARRNGGSHSQPSIQLGRRIPLSCSFVCETESDKYM